MEKGYSAARESDFRFWLLNYPDDFQEVIGEERKRWNLDGPDLLCNSEVNEKG